MASISRDEDYERHMPPLPNDQAYERNMTSLPSDHEYGDREKSFEMTEMSRDDNTLHVPDSREAESRLNDDLELLRAERLISDQENEARDRLPSRSRTRRQPEPADAFNTVTHKEDEEPTGNNRKQTFWNKVWVFVRTFPRLIRYFVYMFPIGIILLVPILLDMYALKGEETLVGGPGGVELVWFGIWLEILWLSLWCSRILCTIIPHIFRFFANTAGSTNAPKWREIGHHLELHAALFIWMLTNLCVFTPIMNGHRGSGTEFVDGKPPHITWIDVVQKIIIALFVLAALNFGEKILIQWITTSFHLRTYAHRIANNKREIRYLVDLFDYARNHASGGDLPWDPDSSSGMGGDRTSLRALRVNARQVFGKVGDAANRIAGDFTGRKILKSDHPQKLVAELLRTTAQSHTLARMIYRTLVKPAADTVMPEDMAPVFKTQDEADTCFMVFDKDLNGDISMEELEIACNEIHLEKKAIAASLKDLDSVIKKLDKVFLCIILIIDVIVFISIISGSAAAALGSAGTTVLGLSWLLQATAQEFLQSIIFVFVKHPFDVGDRVTIYGNTGEMMRGDDYYVQEISLLYTEFKKMQGQVVQAPNSVLNVLFILNQRRSNGLAAPIILVIKYGTPNELIEELKARMLDFVLENKRDFAPKIITELVKIDECWSFTMEFVYFHKSSYQNELLRLQRHNKFCIELMKQMVELGIEGPRRMAPGGSETWPLYLAKMPQDKAPAAPAAHDGGLSPGPFAPQMVSSPVDLHRRRRGGENRGTMSETTHDFQDVYDSRRHHNQPFTRLPSIREPQGSSTGLDSGLSRASTSASSRSLLGRQHSMWSRYRAVPRESDSNV